MRDFEIGRDLAERLAKCSWVESVEVWSRHYLKEKVPDYFSVDVSCWRVKTHDEYLDLVSQITDAVPEVEKWEKSVSSYAIKLSYEQNTKELEKHLIFEIRCREVPVLSQVAGCTLVQTKHSYTTLSCATKVEG